MFGIIVISILFGIALTVILEFLTIRSGIVMTYPSRFNFEETAKMLTQAVTEAGFTLLSSEMLNGKLREKEVYLGSRIWLIKFYKAEYMGELLKERPCMACLMPHTVAVYETSKGSVEISRLNTGMIGKVMGAAARILGEKAFSDEKKILESVLVTHDNVS